MRANETRAESRLEGSGLDPSGVKGGGLGELGVSGWAESGRL